MELDAPHYSSPGFSRIRCKRQRVGESITAEQAKDAVRAILALDDSYKDPTKSMKLPYPGMGRPCSRPGPDIDFVGRVTVFELLCDFKLEEFGQYLVYGPKGVGKSTDFRAVACLLYQSFAKSAGDVKERLVFLWTELLVLDEVAAVRNALMFTFLVDEVQDYGDWQAVQEAIDKIDSMDKAVEFVEERKEQPSKEKFHFFVDGGEQLDAMDFLGRPSVNSQHRSAVGISLNKLLVTGARIWWCTSPKAQMIDPDLAQSSINRFRYEDRGFSKAEYEQFASGSFLGKLKSENQLSVIGELTGYVPLFLEAFCACCEQFGREALEAEQEDLKHSNLSSSAIIDALRALKLLDVAVLLEEDDNWDAVVRKYMHHDEVIRVRKKAEKIQLKGECESDEEMAKLDMTYVLNAAEGRYCSRFIKRIYMTEVRSKEEQLKHYADGAWMEYARRLMTSTRINWSTLGHLCEDVLASVIQKKGMVLGRLNIVGDRLTVLRFDKIPSRTIQSLLQLKTNSGYYCHPRDVSFPYVDAVIVWVDETGKVYIVALQYTVNIDRHMKSASQFMNLLFLRQWFPDIESYLGDRSQSMRGAGSSSGHQPVELHYAFVGCSSRTGYSGEKQQGNLRISRQGPHSGIPPYELHIQPFDDKCFRGLHADDFKILVDITKHRVWKTSYSDVVPNGLGLLALSRRELEKMARKEFGIADPSSLNFKNKGLLINEMVKLKPDFDL